MGIDKEFSAAGLNTLIHKKLLQGTFGETHIDPSNPNALRPGIEVVTIDNTANWWPRNPLEEIFTFRGREVNNLGWRDHIHFVETPLTKQLAENDNSDFQGTVYFVKRFEDGEIACTVRVHPGVDKFGRDISMIGKNIPQLIPEGKSLPLAEDIFETSRVIVDDARLPRRLPDGSRNTDRSKAALECLAASAVYAPQGGYKGFFCFMPEKIWQATYPQLGLEVQRLGPSVTMQDQPDSPTYQVYAGYMEFSPEILDRVSKISGIYPSSFNFGMPPEQRIQQVLDLAEQINPAPQTYSSTPTPPSNTTDGAPDADPYR